MAKPSKSDYIRWVKGSLNRLLNASLADDGTTLLEYRSWLITFQMKHKLTVNAQVDRPTQDALIKANRKRARAYVRWIQNALLISGQGVMVGGKHIAADGSWGPHTEQAVKAFQAKHEKVKAEVRGRRQHRTAADAADRHGPSRAGRRCCASRYTIPSHPDWIYRSARSGIPSWTGVWPTGSRRPKVTERLRFDVRLVDRPDRPRGDVEANEDRAERWRLWRSGRSRHPWRQSIFRTQEMDRIGGIDPNSDFRPARKVLTPRTT